MRLSRRFLRATALTLCLCLAAAMPAALAEGDILSEDWEAQVGPAESVGADNGLLAEGEAAFTAPEAAADGAEKESERGVAAPASAMFYARTLADDTPVYVDDVSRDALASLAAGEIVLVTGAGFDLLPVAFNAGGTVVEGAMDAASLAALATDEADAWLDAAAGEGVALYAGDLDWPLAALSKRSAEGLRDLLASSNYTDLGNDKVYTINGKEIHAGQFPDTGSGHCWSWAQQVYQEVWGFKFSENFKGSSATGMNLLRELNDAQRLLTPEHLKVFVLNSQPGASLRIAACSSECSSFDNDGLSCGHKGHSLIIVDKSSDGVTTMDSHSNSQHTRFYSWQGFCNAWKGYTYVKYIKWPGAPALSSSQVAESVIPGTSSQPSTPTTVAVTGVSLNATATRVLEGASLTLKATVSPADATDKSLSWSSSDAGVATVRDGVITGVAPGEATITVSAGNGAATALCQVTVVTSSGQKTLSKTGSNGTVKLVPGMKLQLIPKFATSKGWKFKSAKSSNPACAALDSTGVVTALAEGTTTITILTQNGKKATLTVKVIDPYVASKVALNKKGTVKLKKGKTLQLKAKLSPVTAMTGLTWKSSKPAVASVDENGLVTALKKGSCYIGVGTENGKYAKVKITVP